MDLQIGETEVTRKALELLAAQNIPFEKLVHEPVTTSEAAAGARGSRLEQGAKALIVKANDQYYHLIISAAKRVDNNKLRKILGTNRFPGLGMERRVQRSFQVRLDIIPTFWYLLLIKDDFCLHNNILL